MINLTVNGQPVTVPDGTTVLQAVRAAGVELPTLCYHEGLAPYGACRLCMVVITAPRHALVASCAYPVEEGMVVETNVPEAATARHLALEFLLSRCPQSDVIREMAAKEGITTSRAPKSAPPARSRWRTRATSASCIPGTPRWSCTPAHSAAAFSSPNRCLSSRRCSPKSKTCGRCAPSVANSGPLASGLNKGPPARCETARLIHAVEIKIGHMTSAAHFRSAWHLCQQGTSVVPLGHLGHDHRDQNQRASHPPLRSESFTQKVSRQGGENRLQGKQQRRPMGPPSH